jgi:Tol biopolymer transport system component
VPGVSEVEWNIWSMDINGDNLKVLTSGSGRDDDRPRLSSDGTKLAYRSAELPWGSEFFGYRMNSDESNQIRITDDVIKGKQSWSPDDSRIAFTKEDENGNYGIFTMDADGLNETRLTSTGNSNQQPDW